MEIPVYFFTGFDSINDYVERRLPAARNAVMEEMLVSLGVDEKNKKALLVCVSWWHLLFVVLHNGLWF